MERQKNETAAAVTEAMRTGCSRIVAEWDTVYACVHSFGCQLNVSTERIRGMLTELAIP
ncbi:MAG: hypothetical protein ACLTXT_04070 [Ruminococcus callidus]